MTQSKYYRVFYRTRRERLIMRVLRRPLNAFAKRVISRAKEIGLINNFTFHEIAGIIDHSLWPERYSTHWVTPKSRDDA